MHASRHLSYNLMKVKSAMLLYQTNGGLLNWMLPIFEVEQNNVCKSKNESSSRNLQFCKLQYELLSGGKSMRLRNILKTSTVYTHN